MKARPRRGSPDDYLTVEEVATQVAVRLEATKLIFLMDAEGVRNGRRQRDLTSFRRGKPANNRQLARRFRVACRRARNEGR